MNSRGSPITARSSGRGSRRCWPPDSNVSCGAPICPQPLRAQLRAARATLWSVIDRSAALRTSELWSWSYADGQYRMEPFGRAGADVDESNAAQLWSTVFLGTLTRRYFAWKLISLPSSGRASNTPPVSAATPKMRELLSVRPSSSETFVPRSANCQWSPTFAVMPKSQVLYVPSCCSPD